MTREDHPVLFIEQNFRGEYPADADVVSPVYSSRVDSFVSVKEKETEDQ
jgi:hypothetical protein